MFRRMCLDHFDHQLALESFHAQIFLGLFCFGRLDGAQNEKNVHGLACTFFVDKGGLFFASGCSCFFFTGWNACGA